MDVVKKLASAIENASAMSPLDRDVIFSFNERPPISGIRVDPAKVEISQKIALLKQADGVVRSHGPEVIQARSIFFNENRHVLQVNSEGTILDFERKGLVFIVHVTGRFRRHSSDWI